MSRLGETVRGSFAIVARIALWPARVAAARGVMAQLCAMDARELADIGLTRQDLCDAASVQLGDDPTRVLSERASQARLQAYEKRPAVRSNGRSHAPREWARTGL